MMRQGYIYLLFGLLVLGVLSNACVSDIDLDQVDEFVLEPEIELSLVYFDFLGSDFDEDDPENSNSYIDSTQADLFSQDFFDQNLKAAEFTLMHTNFIEREFEAEIIFKDAAGNVLYVVNVQIPPFDGTPREVVTLIYFDESQIGILKNTFTISAEIALLPGNPRLTSDSEGSIKFESSAIFYMEFE